METRFTHKESISYPDHSKTAGPDLLLCFILILMTSPLLGSAGPLRNKLDLVLNELFYFKMLSKPLPLLKTVLRNDSVHVLIRSSSPTALKNRGFLIRPVSEQISTSFLSLSEIEFLSHLPEVEAMEAASVCKPALDVSVQEIRANEVWKLGAGKGYKGSGVIVGIFDSGIDWSHPDFISANGTSRIFDLWDQTDDRGPHPAGYTYGTLYSQTQINDELDGSPTGLVQEKDLNGHGTHVAGIAAGNGRGTGNGKPSGVYKGVAPEADLIVVKGGEDTYLDTRILDGAKWIFDKAKERNKPAVVNLSLGKQYGPHDGTSLFEQGIDGLLWERGRAIVVAAGNDGDNPIHFQKVLTSINRENTIVIPFQVGKNQPTIADHIYFDIWYSVFSNLSVSVISPSLSTKGPVSSGSTVKNWETNEGRIYIDNASSGTNQNNGDREILIRVTDESSNGKVSDNLATGTWQLVLTGKAGQFDGWLYDSTVDAKLTNEVNYSTLLIEPGNARRVITVAAYISRNSWPSLWSDPMGIGGLTIGDTCGFSSPGPTRPNLLNSNPPSKPDLSAPGEYILSTLSSQKSDMPTDHWIATDSRHTVLRGTSMAAPHIAGLIALMFQANPQASVSDLRLRLIESVRHDAFTGSGWGRYLGYGKVDAYEAVKKLTWIFSGKEKQPTELRLHQNYPNPFNGSTVIELFIPPAPVQKAEAVFEIFDLNGKRIKSFHLDREAEGMVRLFWDGRNDTGFHASSGVYVYRLMTGDGVLSRKMIYIR